MSPESCSTGSAVCLMKSDMFIREVSADEVEVRGLLGVEVCVGAGAAGAAAAAGRCTAGGSRCVWYWYSALYSGVWLW